MLNKYISVKSIELKFKMAAKWNFQKFYSEFTLEILNNLWNIGQWAPTRLISLDPYQNIRLYMKVKKVKYKYLIPRKCQLF